VVLFYIEDGSILRATDFLLTSESIMRARHPKSQAPFFIHTVKKGNSGLSPVIYLTFVLQESFSE